MKNILIFVIALMCESAFACGERKVPIEIEVKRYESGNYAITFKAPIDYQEYELLGAQYNSGDSRIPMYEGYSEGDNLTYYELYGEDEFFSNSTITISYSVKNTLCAHTEQFEWKQLLKRCKGCGNA